MPIRPSPLSYALDWIYLVSVFRIWSISLIFSTWRLKVYSHLKVLNKSHLVSYSYIQAISNITSSILHIHCWLRRDDRWLCHQLKGNCTSTLSNTSVLILDYSVIYKVLINITTTLLNRYWHTWVKRHLVGKFSTFNTSTL